MLFNLIMTGMALVAFASVVALVGHPLGIFDIMIDAIGYTVARLVLPILSLGRVHVQPPSSDQRSFNMFGCRRDQAGRIEVEETIASFIGFVMLLVAFFAFCLSVKALV